MNFKQFDSFSFSFNSSFRIRMDKINNDGKGKKLQKNRLNFVIHLSKSALLIVEKKIRREQSGTINGECANNRNQITLCFIKSLLCHVYFYHFNIFLFKSHTGKSSRCFLIRSEIFMFDCFKKKVSFPILLSPTVVISQKWSTQVTRTVYLCDEWWTNWNAINLFCGIRICSLNTIVVLNEKQKQFRFFPSFRSIYTISFVYHHTQTIYIR